MMACLKWLAMALDLHTAVAGEELRQTIKVKIAEYMFEHYRIFK